MGCIDAVTVRADADYREFLAGRWNRLGDERPARWRSARPVQRINQCGRDQRGRAPLQSATAGDDRSSHCNLQTRLGQLGAELPYTFALVWAKSRELKVCEKRKQECAAAAAPRHRDRA